MTRYVNTFQTRETMCNTHAAISLSAPYHTVNNGTDGTLQHRYETACTCTATEPRACIRDGRNTAASSDVSCFTRYNLR